MLNAKSKNNYAHETHRYCHLYRNAFKLNTIYRLRYFVELCMLATSICSQHTDRLSTEVFPTLRWELWRQAATRWVVPHPGVRLRRVSPPEAFKEVMKKLSRLHRLAPSTVMSFSIWLDFKLGDYISEDNTTFFLRNVNKF